MKAHFAIIRDNTRRYNRDSICQLEEIPAGQANACDNLTYSPCGGFAVYEAGKLFMSEILTVDLELIENVEAEIDNCNLLISKAHKEMYDRVEYALEPVKARKTELMQISHQTASKADIAQAISEDNDSETSSSYMPGDELFDIPEDDEVPF